MGALFSLENNQYEREEERRMHYYLEIQRREEERQAARWRYLEEQSLQEERRQERLKEIQKTQSIIVIRHVPNNGYELIPLDAFAPKYIELKKLFSKTGKSFMKVRTIEIVYNPIHRALYELKKLEAQQIYKESMFQEKLLYHGTKKANLDAICRVNLDRRKCVLHKFGYGVSFSPFSFYASHYCDKQKKPQLDKLIDKKMFVCRVITINSTISDSSTKVPDDGCDYTTSNERGDVVVKYDDDTYYPEYIITFRMIPDKNRISPMSAFTY